MPVIREKNQISPAGSSGFTQATGLLAQSRSLGEAAAATAEIGSTIGRLLAAETEREARLLAQQVAFTVDENGVPQIPEDARKQLSWAGRRVFDEAIDQRFQTRLRTEMGLRLDEAMAEHALDPAAFAGAAAGIAAGMRESVPESFVGRFEDDMRALVSDRAARIGYNSGQMARRQEASDFTSRTLHVKDDMAALIGQGKFAEAEALIDGLETSGAQLVERGIIGADDLTRSKQELRFLYQRDRIITTGRKENYTLEQWRDLERKLRMNDPEMVKQIPDVSNRQAIASHISQIVSDLAGDRRAQIAAQEDAVDLQLAMTGMLPNTEKTAKLVDAGLGQIFSAPGGVMRPDDWTSPSFHTPQVMDAVRRAGVLPESMVRMFRTYASMPPATKEIAATLYKELSRGDMLDGSAVDNTGLLDRLDQRTRDRIELTLLLGESGFATSADGQTDFATIDLRADEILKTGLDLANMQGTDQAALSIYITETLAPTRQPGWRFAVKPDVDASQINSVFSEMIYTLAAEETGGGTMVFKADVDRGVKLAKALLMHGEAPEDVFPKVRQWLVGSERSRYQETDLIWSPSMGRVTRSWGTPQATYRLASPPAESAVPGFPPGDGWWIRRIDAELRAQVGKLDGTMPFEPTPDSSWVVAIKALAFYVEDGGDKATGNLMLPGRDYLLQPIGSNRMAPDYRVFVRTNAGEVLLLDDLGAPVRISLRSGMMDRVETGRRKEHEAAAQREETTRNDKALIEREAGIERAKRDLARPIN